MGSSQARGPILFLDFDDVLCLNTTYGGYDVILALAQIEKGTARPEDFREMWTQLFDGDAKAYLKALHEEFEPRYVLSTSWRKFLDKEAFITVFENCGLEFVAKNLHPAVQTPAFESPQLAWRTPGFLSPPLRAREIGSWLARNPDERGWVVLDDECSGTGLDKWSVEKDRACIVLCQEGVGLTGVEYERLRDAFLLRVEQGIST